MAGSTAGTSNIVPDMEQMDALLIAAAEEIEGNRAALKIAQQSLIEFSHAQECGPSWYTRGALGPCDDNGRYLKERPGAEPSGGVAIRHPGDEQKHYTYPWAGFEQIVFQPNWRTVRIWKEGDNLCFIAGPAEIKIEPPHSIDDPGRKRP